jgi:hypothetical protein
MQIELTPPPPGAPVATITVTRTELAELWSAIGNTRGSGNVYCALRDACITLGVTSEDCSRDFYTRGHDGACTAKPVWG